MRLVGVELFKLRTQLAMRILLLAAFGVTLLGLALFILGTQVNAIEQFDLSSSVLQRQLLGLGGGTTLILVFAVVGITSEYRHRTITSTFLAVPIRYRVLLAKLAAYSIVAVAFGIVVAFITTSAVLILLGLEDVPLALSWNRIVMDYARDLAGLVLYAAFGFGVGAVVANQIAGIVIVLVEPVVAQITAAAFPKVGRFFPSQAADAFLAEQQFFFTEKLSPEIGGLVFGAWVVWLLAAGISITQRRDIT